MRPRPPIPSLILLVHALGCEPPEREDPIKDDSNADSEGDTSETGQNDTADSADTPDTPDTGEPSTGCEALPWKYVTGTEGPDTAWSLHALPDGDLLFVSNEGPSLATDIVLRRLAPDGSPRWERSSDSGRGDEAFVVTERDGVVWVGGLTRSSESVFDLDTTALVLRFDLETGEPVGEAWSWDSPGWDEVDGIVLDESAAFVSGWASGDKGNQDLRVVSLDRDTLATRWERTLGADALEAANGRSVLLGERLYVGGSWNSEGVLGTAQGTVVAFDTASGETLWQSIIGGGKDYREILGLGSDGARLYATGWRRVTLTDWQLMVWGLDLEGGILWEAEWGLEHNERSRSLAADPKDGSILVAGTTNRRGSDDLVLLRLDPSNGALLEETLWGGIGGEGASDIALQGDGAFVATQTGSWGGSNGDAMALGFCHRPWEMPGKD